MNGIKTNINWQEPYRDYFDLNFCASCTKSVKCPQPYPANYDDLGLPYCTYYNSAVEYPRIAHFIQINERGSVTVGPNDTFNSIKDTLVSIFGEKLIEARYGNNIIYKAGQS